MAEEVQRESTSQDYWNTLNPGGIPYAHPEVRFNAATDLRGGVDIKEPVFANIFEQADGPTKMAMIQANNNSDALKIAERRQIFYDSQKAIEQDGMLTQLGMGVLPAIASPSSVLPMGSVFKVAQMAKTTSRLMTGLQVAGAGAVTGAVANIADEALFDLQGMPTNYVGAGAIGAVFGGSLGFLGGMLSGPTKQTIAKAISPEHDTYSRHFSKDPDFLMVDEMGVPKLQDVGQMDKSWVDRIPFIGQALRSDVHTVLQSENPFIRSLMLRMANATTSLRDAAGNILPVNKNGLDYKREVKGIHNGLTKEITYAYNAARQEGYSGSIDDFNVEVWKAYTTAMAEQRNAAYKYSQEMNVDVIAKNKADREAALKEIDEDLVYYRDETGKEVPMTEDLMGRIPDEAIVIKQRTKKDKATMKEEINTKFAEELDLAIKKTADEFFDKNVGTFKGSQPIVKGSEAYRKYFQDMLKKSQEVGIKELQGMNVNRLYAPRIYDYKGIRAGNVSQDTLKTEVRLGLMNDARNGGLTGKQLDAAVEDIVSFINKSTFNTELLTNSFLVKDLPFSTHLQQKKLHLNENYMPSIIKDNFGDITGAYHYKMSGRQATQYSFGTDQLEDIMKLVHEKEMETGIKATPEELKAFDRTVKDLIGVLRMNQLADTPAWTFTRNLTSFNSARLGGGFGGNQFIELVSSVLMNGVQALMSGRLFKSLKNSSDLLYAQNGKHDDFAEFLINSGFMEDTLHTSRINRYADTESGFNSGWLENKLNWMNDKLMKYNGMRYFMGVMEDYTGSAIVTKLKKGNVEEHVLARWGLSKEDAASLKNSLKEVTTDKSWDLSKLSDLERDKLQLAVARGIEEIVVQGDSIHLPAWMKAPSPFTKVLTQFMRFPLIAQETLTRRGFKEDQAQMIAGVLGSVSTYMGIKYLREQAAISIGAVHEIDSKYDYENFTDEDYLRVIGEALNYTAPLGFLSSVYNYSAIATGNNELGREWSSKNGMSALLGPSGGLGEDVIQIIRAAVEGEITDERTLQRVKSLTPFMNLPLINEGGKYLTEEFGD